jgi:hypothetical protein
MNATNHTPHTTTRAQQWAERLHEPVSSDDLERTCAEHGVDADQVSCEILLEKTAGREDWSYLEIAALQVTWGELDEWLTAYDL